MVKQRKLQPQSVWDVEAVCESLRQAGIRNAEQHAYRMWGFMIRQPLATWHVRILRERAHGNACNKHRRRCVEGCSDAAFRATAAIWLVCMSLIVIAASARQNSAARRRRPAWTLNNVRPHDMARAQDVPGLPQAARAVLDASYVKFTSKLEAVQRSTDGETCKLLLTLQDGLRIEAVVMNYDTKLKNSQPADAEDDGTPGTMGLQGNLSAGEIVEQLAFACQFSKIRNVVFMGMGEPLQNYDAVKTAVLAMTDGRMFSLARKHVTVSTVGVIPRILSLATELPGISLALSLHAPTQELRASIVPSAKAYKLDKLIAAVDEYIEITGQKVFVEYVMMRLINDNPEQAHELGQLLKGKLVTINLIPWNPVYSPTMKIEAPGVDRLTDFHAIVREYGLPCTVRQEKGQEISSACGQLVIQHKETGATRDIEELASRLCV